MGVSRALARGVPHLAGFLPGRVLGPPVPGCAPAWLEGLGRAPATEGVLLAEGPFRAPRFGRRHAPVALLVMPGCRLAPGALARCLEGPPPPASAAPAWVAPFLREARIGGAAGLPDPGPRGLGLPAEEAVLVLDPGRRSLRHPAAEVLARAQAGAAGRPVLLALDPAAPPGAGPVLVPPAGVHRLPGRLAPWTLLDLAHRVHGLGQETEWLALLAGKAESAGMTAEAALGTVLVATRCADPFRGRPWGLAEALRQLADWRVQEAEARRIHACTGMEVFKRPAVRAHLARSGPPALFLARASAALRSAGRRGGAVAVWSAAMPPGLPARAEAAGVPLVQMEDGFLRSAGLGVALAPPLSMVLDWRGMHFDPALPNDLEALLAGPLPDEALLARAAALRAALTAAGLSKYNLVAAAPLPPLPADRPALLVVGQVAGDASLTRGGGRIRDNAALLRAVRAENPGAFILYRPHPDVVSGMRAGAIAAAEADAVVPDAPLPALFGAVDAVHVMSSLAGFEALLHGARVVCWGQPFYAGWGLTEDRDPPPRRGVPIGLDALVANALIRYPRYLDPVTRLPCPVEVVVERLAAAGPAAPPRLSAWSRRWRGWLARASGAGARFWAAR